MTARDWSKCARVGCKKANVRQYGVKCEWCHQPFRGAVPVDDADIDETLLLRSRERLVGELKRVDERLAELALLKRK